jgi:hypothetical protein
MRASDLEDRLDFLLGVMPVLVGSPCPLYPLVDVVIEGVVLLDGTPIPNDALRSATLVVGMSDRVDRADAVPADGTLVLFRLLAGCFVGSFPAEKKKQSRQRTTGRIHGRQLTIFLQ